jgi:hypothetical protein
MWIFESSDPYIDAVTNIYQLHFRFKLAAIDIRYWNVMPLIFGEYVSS